MRLHGRHFVEGTGARFGAANRWRGPQGAGVLLSAALLASCVTLPTEAPRDTPAKPAPAVPDANACQPVAAQDALAGNWLGVRRQKGVAGELRTQIVLGQDGDMLFTEQLKRGNRPPQTLEEKGCWWREDGVLVLKTTHSHGLAVDAQDPIYINRYPILQPGGNLMTLGISGQEVRLRRVAPDYRLPVL